MGMFDYIRSEVPLPDGFKGELQTKDFNCEMGEHVIRADGRLILAILDHTEQVPREERPYPDDDGLLGLAGSLRFIWRHEDANFHGIVNFYGSEYLTASGEPAHARRGVLHGPDGIKNAETGELLEYISHEYNAKFTDGQLVEIAREEP